MSKLSKSQRNDLIRIIVAMVMFAALIVMEHLEVLHGFGGNRHHLVMFGSYLIPYFIVGYDVVKNCFVNVAHGQMFDETFLMTLATIGAFGCREFEEAVAVMLFYQVGEFFQSYAVGKSRGAIQELMSIAPEYANRENPDGSIEVIDPDDVEIGDVLVVKPGEKIPVDAVVTDGEGYINTSALTGESMPLFVQPGDDIISGCINGDKLIRIRAKKLYDDSTVAQILEMVENAASRKSKTEAFITRFARYYTPIVVVCGALLAFVPPIFAGNLGMWILRACTFLVISCPCALVISVPLAFFGGIGAASKIGVLVKGSNYLEMMAQLEAVVTDKTGTLTEGKFRVTDVEAAPGRAPEELLRYAAAAESGSTHPIAVSIVEEYRKTVGTDGDEKLISSDVENVAGKGIMASVAGKRVIAGNAAMMEVEKIAGIGSVEEKADNGSVAERTENESVKEKIENGSVVYVAIDGAYAGRIIVADAPKIEAKRAISGIIAEKVQHVVMLTGDAEETATAVASELGITDVRARLLPQDKVKAVEELLGNIRDAKRYLAFVGDGINDAPVLARADVGIAMGSLGSDAAIEAADIVIMDDNIEKIPALIRIARKTVSISKANIAFALGVKVACLILGAVGIANMWVAVFADVGVAMICILNSMRMLINSSASM